MVAEKIFQLHKTLLTDDVNDLKDAGDKNSQLCHRHVELVTDILRFQNLSTTSASPTYFVTYFVTKNVFEILSRIEIFFATILKVDQNAYSNDQLIHYRSCTPVYIHHVLE